MLSVEIDFIEIVEIGAAGLFAFCQKIENTFLFIDPDELRHHPIALRDLVLDFSGSSIIEIQMSPVVPLGIPDDFIRMLKITPVDIVPARFILCGYGLGENFA